MKRLFWAVIITSMVFTIGCGEKNVDKKKSRGNSKGKSKKSMIVKKGSIIVKLEETGEIRPIKEIDIKSKVSGKIIKLYVEEGDYVKNGSIIADIEPDYNQAEVIARVKSTLRLNEIRLNNAKKTLEDKEKIKEFISETELSRAKDSLIEAQINYDDAFSQNELIKEIESKNNISKIISSASGTVILKPVEEGEMVVAGSGAYSEGTVIVKLADLERMVVSARINEVDIAKVSKGQHVSIKLDAFPYDDFSGKINKIAAMAISYNNVKVFPIEVEIEDVSSKIKPGMTANITIIGEDKKDILVIPIRAIFSNDTGMDIVYRVENDTISSEQLIKTGINDFQKVEIIEGIAEGDTISLVEKFSDKPVDIKVRF